MFLTTKCDPDIKIYSFGNEIFVNAEFEGNTVVDITVLNVVGQPIFKSGNFNTESLRKKNKSERSIWYSSC